MFQRISLNALIKSCSLLGYFFHCINIHGLLLSKCIEKKNKKANFQVIVISDGNEKEQTEIVTQTFFI